jgi:hypothetical protein
MEIILAVYLVGYLASLRSAGKRHFEKKAQPRCNHHISPAKTKERCRYWHNLEDWHANPVERTTSDSGMILLWNLAWPFAGVSAMVGRLIPKTAAEKSAELRDMERSVFGSQVMVDDRELPSFPSLGSPYGKPSSPPSGPSPLGSPYRHWYDEHPIWSGFGKDQFTYENMMNEDQELWFRIDQKFTPGDRVELNMRFPASMWIRPYSERAR